MYAMRTQQEIAKQNAAAMAAERAQREGYGPDGWPLRGEELLAFARERFPEPWLISFSCGKDSLAAWLWLRERGIQLVPYYLYWVPGLSFVEEALAYYEEFFGTHIIRLPHPYFYRTPSASGARYRSLSSTAPTSGSGAPPTPPTPPSSMAVRSTSPSGM